jgi:hypothetical protein
MAASVAFMRPLLPVRIRGTSRLDLKEFMTPLEATGAALGRIGYRRLFIRFSQAFYRVALRGSRRFRYTE